MAKLEAEKRTGLQEAVELSRQLPQLGLHPEISFQNTQSLVGNKTHERQTEPVTDPTKVQPNNKQDKTPFNYKWGIFSAFSDYLNGKL